MQPDKPWLYSTAGFRYCALLLDQDDAPELRERAQYGIMIALRNSWIIDIALDRLNLGRALLRDIQHVASENAAEATSYIQQALTGINDAGFQEFLPLGLLARAELHTYTGAFADARADLDEAMDIATHCGFRLHECDAHLGYARLAIAEKNWTDAEAHLNEARKIIDDTGYHRRDREVGEIGNALEQLEPAPVTIGAADEKGTTGQ